MSENKEASELKIIEASDKDIEPIKDLWIDFVVHHTKIDSLMKLEINAEDYYREYISNLIKSDTSVVYIAKNEDQYIGYGMGGLKTPPPPLEEYTYGLISEIFVKEDYRKRGIGINIVKQLEKWFHDKKVKYIEIDVFMSNREAVEFWHGYGYYIKRYVMRKEILD